jgi:hypothetical protein
MTSTSMRSYKMALDYANEGMNPEYVKATVAAARKIDPRIPENAVPYSWSTEYKGREIGFMRVGFQGEHDSYTVELDMRAMPPILRDARVAEVGG